MSSPLVTIFVRHAEGCKHSADEFFKRCDCRKHLRWTLNGAQQRRQAGTRSWAEAEAVKRGIEDQLSGKPVEVKVEARTIADSVRVFIQVKTVEGITLDGLQRYTRELAKLQTYAERGGVFTLAGLTGEVLTAYIATWTTSSGTRALALKTLKCFLRHCYDAQWLPRVPKLPRIAVDAAETAPLTDDEYAALLAACRPIESNKLRALIQLMRYSGLAIRDAATLRRDAIQPAGRFYRVVTKRQKTGVAVSVPIPSAIAEEILAVENDNPLYIFWHGVGDGKNFAVGYGSAMSAAFDRAQIADVCFMKSHRLRDTFAVDLLTKGVPMEEVSKMLGHETMRTTEKHYAKWVKGRQDRLDSLVTGTWAA